MKNEKIEEMEYIEIPKFEDETDSVSILIRRIAAVVRRWAVEELSGRHRKLEDKIDY